MDFVFDASTLILLAKSTLLQDVVRLCSAVVPESVRKECLVKRSYDSAIIEQLIREGRIEVRKLEHRGGARQLRRDFRLGVGEADSIWLARELGRAMAVDDGQAIKACKVIGVRFATAVHFLLSLASSHRLGAEIAQEKLAELARVGRYGRRIIEDARNRLGEVERGRH